MLNKYKYTYISLFPSNQNWKYKCSDSASFIPMCATDFFPIKKLIKAAGVSFWLLQKNAILFGKVFAVIFLR